MGYLGDKYNSPEWARSEKEFDKEMELRRTRGREKLYFCFICLQWIRLRELDEPPKACPKCRKRWNHHKRWLKRMQSDKEL